MRNLQELNEFLKQNQIVQDATLELEESRIEEAYHNKKEQASFGIKLLSILGGIFGSYMFVLFTYALGLADSDLGMLILGSVCLLGAILINNKFSKIIYDTFSACFLIIGFSSINLGLTNLISTNSNLLVLMLLALFSWYFSRNYMMSFISVLTINLGVFLLIVINEEGRLLGIYVPILAIGFTYLMLNEAKLIRRSAFLSARYNPLKTGLLFCLTIGLCMLSTMELLDTLFYMGKSGGVLNYKWFASAINIFLVLYFLSRLFKLLEVTDFKYKLLLYTLSSLVLLLSIVSPAISGTILILLLSFMSQYRTGFVLGVLGFIFFLSKFYYDLDFSLLTKSILLFSSGIIFLALYFLTSKKLSTYEKV